MNKVCVVLFLFITLARNTLQIDDFEQIKLLVTQWAPLIWMSPEEEYFPTDVNTFLQNVHLVNENGKAVMLSVNETHFPQFNTKPLHLVTNLKLDFLLKGMSFLNGNDPNQYSVPTYVIITPCTPNQSFRASSVRSLQSDLTGILNQETNPELFFSASYWTFYPYNKGKSICFLGRVPTLALFGRCFGRPRTIGSHVGDWEHISLTFKGHPFPSNLYIAIHDTGGHYKFDFQNQLFRLNPLRNKRGIRVQRPKLPSILRLQEGHPVLFAAEGSHGLWPTPGEHEYVRLPRLTDKCAYGIPWKTWNNLQIYDLASENLPKWLFFKGRWGNQKTNCWLPRKLLCELTDGPMGILRNKEEFYCGIQ